MPSRHGSGPVVRWSILTVVAAGCSALGAVGCASQPQTVSLEVPSRNRLAPVSDLGRDLTADQQVLQVLNRLTFGPKPGDVQRVRAQGVDRWIAWQLSPQSIPDATADAFVAHLPAYQAGVASLESAYPPPMQVLAAREGPNVVGGPTRLRPMTPEDSAAVMGANRASAQLVADVQIAKVGRALVSERQLQEVMVDFWENHFTVYDRKGQRMRYFLAAYDRDAIRPYVLGHFRDLLGAIAKSPAMLFYLDNWESAADSSEPTLDPRRPRPMRSRGGSPPATPGVAPGRRPRGLNENYGRELLELHTLGVDGGYTQQDVINVARALTGWSIAGPREPNPGTFEFRPRFHDAGRKVVLGHVLPEGRGIEDGEDVLDILAHHPSTAHFIARKLCQRFVSDSPPPALVDRAAARFTATDGDIRQVLWTILTSNEFFSRAAYHAKVKSPFEVVVSALRVIDAAPDTSERTARLIARMGEPLFGHQAPNGYPETGESWMNTGAILNRINFGLAVAAGRVPGASLDRWPVAAILRSAPRAVQVDTAVDQILGGTVSPDTRAILMSGDNPLLTGSTPPEASPTPGGLAQVVGLALGAPEFQRR